MEVIIHIEHQSTRQDIGQRMVEYMCLAWLMKKKRIWSIVVYTDDAIWKKDIPDSFAYGVCSRDGSYETLKHNYNIIKLNKEKSKELITRTSLFCKLLSLKADDSEVNREELVRDIFNTVAKLQNELSDSKKLLVLQWTSQYCKIDNEKFEEIKKEVQMEYVENIITDHYKMEGFRAGEIKGRFEGVKEGKMKMVKAMIDKGVDMATVINVSGFPKHDIESLCIAEKAAPPYGNRLSK